MEPIRTKETMTAGVVSTPMTYPATLFFNIRPELLPKVIQIFESYQVKYDMTNTINDKKEIIYHLQARHEIDSNKMKSIWHNFRTLRPKFKSRYRYPFWEIDTKDWSVVERIVNTYRDYDLPVYVHESMRGYHFICIKPIEIELWKKMIFKFRYPFANGAIMGKIENENYPPICLRLKANKYINEIESFKTGFIVSRVLHSDTDRFRKYLENQQIDILDRYYMIVWYPIDKELLVIE